MAEEKGKVVTLHVFYMTAGHIPKVPDVENHTNIMYEAKGIRTSEKIRQLQRKLYQKAKHGYESHWKKITGKPHSGKPNEGFDEGKLEIELLATTPALYSTGAEVLTNT